MKLNQFYVDNLIKEAISEDINYIDVSADYLLGFPKHLPYPRKEK